MRPPPIVRWTGSYGLVQADRPRISPAASTQGMIPGFVISVFSSVLLDWPFGAFRRQGHKRPAPGTPHSKPTFRRFARRDATAVCHFWEPSVWVHRKHPIAAIRAEGYGEPNTRSRAPEGSRGTVRAQPRARPAHRPRAAPAPLTNSSGPGLSRPSVIGIGICTASSTFARCRTDGEGAKL